jgi:hypothetical protein
MSLHRYQCTISALAQRLGNGRRNWSFILSLNVVCNDDPGLFVLIAVMDALLRLGFPMKFIDLLFVFSFYSLPALSNTMIETLLHKLPSPVKRSIVVVGLLEIGKTRYTMCYDLELFQITLV